MAAASVSPGSVSDIVPRILVLPTATPSEHESTDIDSTAPQEDPAWQPSLRDRLRFYRHRSIPGWFDRIDGAPLPTDSIGSVRYKVDQANLRRRMACDLAFHTASVNVLLAVCVDTVSIAQPLRLAFQSPEPAALLVVALFGLLVLLKLVLDAPWVRAAVFAVYTATLVVLLAVVQLAWDAPHDLVACAVCLTVSLLVYCWLSGFQYRGAFLSFSTLWTVLALVAGAGLGLASTIPDTFTAQGATLFAICSLLAATFGCVYETLAFLHTLSPHEAPLALFLTHIDAAAVLLYVLHIAIMVAAGLVVAALATALDPVLTVVKALRKVWLSATNRRASRVVVGTPERDGEPATLDAHSDQ